MFTLGEDTTVGASKVPRKEKSYNHPCPYPNCPRTFTCPHNVDQHVREKHTGERPNKCDHCPKAFARPFALYRHLAVVHGIDIRPGRGRTVQKRSDLQNTLIKKRRDAAKSRQLGLPTALDTGGDRVCEIGQPIPFDGTTSYSDSNDVTIEGYHHSGMSLKNHDGVQVPLHAADDEAISSLCLCSMCCDIIEYDQEAALPSRVKISDPPMLTENRAPVQSASGVRMQVETLSLGSRIPGYDSIATKDEQPLFTKEQLTESTSMNEHEFNSSDWTGNNASSAGPARSYRDLTQLHESSLINMDEGFDVWLNEADKLSNNGVSEAVESEKANVSLQ